MKREFDNSSEIWKDIPNTDGKYQISNYGNVRRKSNGRLLKPYAVRGGYLVVHLPNKRLKVHRAVADAFVLNINGYPQVDHINRDRTDNQKANLRYVTNTMNQRNKANNRMITINGETRCVAEWSERVGVSQECIKMRLTRGWNEYDAILKPLQNKEVNISDRRDKNRDKTRGFTTANTSAIETGKQISC